MPHLDEGQLTALLDGELTSAERAEVDSHLAGCTECRQLLDETRSFFGEAGGLIEAVQLPIEVPNRPVGPEQRPSPDIVPGHRAGAPSTFRRGGIPVWRSLGWAASIVLAVGFGWFASEFGSRRPTAAPASDIGAASAEQTAVLAKSATPAAPAAAEPSLKPPLVTTGAADKAALSSRGGADARRSTSPAPAQSPAAAAAESNQAANMDELADLGNSIPDAQPLGRLDHAEPQRSRPNPVDFVLQPTMPPSPERVAEPAARRDREEVRTVTLEEAVRSLGGTIRLVDGMVPARVEDRVLAETGGNRNRVVYLDPPGRELWLDQERQAGAAGASIRELDDQPAILAGDTLVVAGAGGRQTLRWVDQTGLRLGLTGFLPADSLRGLARQVR